jgi:hypothetical protein
MLKNLKSRLKQKKKITKPWYKLKSTINSIIRFIPLFHKTYNPNLKAIGLEISTACNLSCINCENSCRQAPSSEFMSLEQIEKFVDESIELNWDWNIIKLRGGEPTLHPQFFEVLKIIKRCKDLNPRCKIILQTNGQGKKVNEILSKIPDWVEVHNEGKEIGYISSYFSSYNVAPIDLSNYRLFADFTKGCFRAEECNIGLTRYGYYPCSPGGSSDRIFGFNIGLKKLSEVKDKALRAQMNKLCRYCGHYKEPNEYVKGEKMSKSWVNAYKKYKKQKPGLSLY